MIILAGIKFYTVLETAKLLRISSVTVRTYIKKGRLKAQRVGRPVLISEEGIKEFLTGKKQEQNQE